MKQDIILFMASGLFLIILVVSLLAPFLAEKDPLEIDMTNRLTAPSIEYWLGTDSLGRDMFTRLLYGGRTAILLAMVATIGTLCIGLVFGLLAGYFGGRVDGIIQYFIHLFQGLPTISIMVAIAGVLGPSAQSILIAVIVSSWADFSRVVRGEVLKVREEPYVRGVLLLGASHPYVMRKYILPNIIGPLIVLSTVRVGRVMLAVAALSFIGIGLQPPLPDWGVMLHDARSYFRTQPHLMVAPGLCIMLTAFSLNVIGDRLRDHLDMKQDRLLGG